MGPRRRARLGKNGGWVVRRPGISGAARRRRAGRGLAGGGTADVLRQAHALFGTKTVIDLVCLMGNYAGTALLLSAVDQQLPEGMAPGLPIP